jgi:undecaprenyl-diphosphatase
MNVFDLLKTWDIALFEWIACTGRVAVLDTLMPYWRSKWFWVPLYIGLTAWFLLQNRRGVLWLAVVLSAAGLADFLSAGVIKPLVQRLRPCKNPDLLDTCLEPLVSCGSGYSFVSAHAANHMAIAVVLFFLMRRQRIRWLWLVWALTIGYGQIYVGVHYPFDVVAGFLLGAIVGYLCCRFGILLENKLFASNKK